jgi:hypothetical protein
VCYTRGPGHNKVEGHAAGTMVLFVCRCTGESHVGIPLVVSGVVVFILGVVSVVGLVVSSIKFYRILMIYLLLQSLILYYVTTMLRDYLEFPSITPELCWVRSNAQE